MVGSFPLPWCDSVGSLPVGAELSLGRILGCAHCLPQDLVSDLEVSVPDFGVEVPCHKVLVLCQLPTFALLLPALRPPGLDASEGLHHSYFRHSCPPGNLWALPLLGWLSCFRMLVGMASPLWVSLLLFGMPIKHLVVPSAICPLPLWAKSWWFWVRIGS